MSNRQAMIEEARKWLVLYRGRRCAEFGVWRDLEDMADFALHVLGDQSPQPDEIRVVKTGGKP